MPPEETSAAPRSRVLVLDDSPLQFALLRRLLAEAGVEALRAPSLAEAERLIVAARPALLLVELLREAGNGFEDGALLMEEHAVPAVLMSASGRRTDAAWAGRLGFAGVLRRPATLAGVRSACAAAGLPLRGT